MGWGGGAYLLSLPGKTKVKPLIQLLLVHFNTVIKQVFF